MTKQNNNVPALRFPEFSEVWEEKEYGTIFRFKITNSFSRENLNYESGNVKNIHYGDIHTKFNTLFDITKEYVPFINREIKLNKIADENYCKEGDLVIADASEDYADVGKCIEITNLNNEKVLAGLHTFLARPDLFKMTVGFSGYLMKSPKVRLQIMTIAQGTKVLSISTGRLSKITLNIPKEPEQQKIVAFLMAVDEKIQQLTKKKDLLEQYKKGVIQQIFDQEIRFKDDNGSDFADWEEQKLTDVVIHHNSGVYKNASLYGEGNNIIGVSDLYSISSIDGQEFRRVTLTKDELAKFTLDEGDLIYGESSLVREGIAKTLFVTNRGAGTAFAWHTRRFKVDSSLVNSSYLYYHLNSPNIRNTIMSVSTQTALTGITTKEYFNISILLPEMNEQQKIANFLSALDDKINLVNQQLEKTQTFKKGLLQQMFV